VFRSTLIGGIKPLTRESCVDLRLLLALHQAALPRLRKCLVLRNDVYEPWRSYLLHPRSQSKSLFVEERGIGKSRPAYEM
jgi:hypothetical protein